MYPNLPQAFKLTPKRKQVLVDLVIDENRPGSILHDFAVMLDVLKQGDMPLNSGAATQPENRSRDQCTAGPPYPTWFETGAVQIISPRTRVVSVGAGAGINESRRKSKEAYPAIG